MATAIVTTVFAAIMPVFVGIRNSADARWASLEMVQNARVLNDHLYRYLAQARRIRSVSTSSDDAGYIEWEAEDGVVYRCALGARGDVEFGPVGGMQALAGPVAYFRFACYGGPHLSTQAQTPDNIQLVTWEAGLSSMRQRARNRVVTGACCLRVRSVGGEN